MIMKTSNFTSSRRQFLKNVLPAGTLFCLGCGNLLAMPSAVRKQQSATQKHKFLEDSGMTLEGVFKFAVENFVPYIQKMAQDIGKEKFIEMLKKASDAQTEQLIASMTKDLPKKDMEALADFMNSFLNSSPYNKALTYEIIKKTDKELEAKFTECLWAKVFREANAEDIGYAIHCYPIDAWARAFNPKIKGTLPKNLMEGQDACIVRFVWEG
ncbi:MAG: L-2-amino-thiazoline-4-carboxylic acid hydrolase [Candidatus Aminicenantales bacterium]